MKDWKVWPHLTIIAILIALLAGVGVALWVKHEQTASAESLPNAARIQHVEGDVSLSNSLDAANNSTEPQWVTATDNQPFSVGDRIYTGDNSRASVAFTGRNSARLNPNTSLDVLSLSNRQTQLALRDGSAIFDVGYLAPGETFEVGTPYGAVDFNEPGLYNVGLDNGSVAVSVLSGLAQIAGLGTGGQIGKGEILTLVGQTAADVVLSRLDGRNAGYLVDDYYASQYPQYYDGRYRDYNVYLNDPYYFDPYRRNVSYQYVNSNIPGLSDLDYYGNWQNLNGYGNAWSPRVADGWAPYQQGYWMPDYPYGLTWVSYEPWGYAPYHYGRWANVDNRWYWLPDTIDNSPRYSPAMVAFVPFGQNELGWVPLGPGDAYAPRFYNNGWQPYYLSRTSNYQQRIANLYVPGAVTVLPVDDFARGFDWRRAKRADRNLLAHVNPILDPLTFTPLRNAVIHSAWGRGKKDLPPGIAKRLRDTTIVTSVVPIAPPFRRDLNREFRVETASERFKDRKFKVKDERHGNPASQAQPAPDQNRFEDRSRGRGSGNRAELRNREDGRINPGQPQGERPVFTNRPPKSERVGNKEKNQWRGNIFTGAPSPADRGKAKKSNVPVPRSVQPVPMNQPRPDRGNGKKNNGPVQRSVQPAMVNQSARSAGGHGHGKAGQKESGGAKQKGAKPGKGN